VAQGANEFRELFRTLLDEGLQPAFEFLESPRELAPQAFDLRSSRRTPFLEAARVSFGMTGFLSLTAHGLRRLVGDRTAAEIGPDECFTHDAPRSVRKVPECAEAASDHLL
jgi:hypothetical protein